MPEFVYVMLYVFAGLIIRTLAPYLLFALDEWRQLNPFPFDKEYLIPPLATGLINLIALGLGVFLIPGAYELVAAMPAREVILWTILEQGVIRDVQKFLGDSASAT